MDELLFLLRKKEIAIPNVLLKYYKNLNIKEKELIFLSYLFSNDDQIPFNVIKFSNNTYFTTQEIMEILSNLCEKNLVNMIVKKDGNIMKEYLDMSILYNKLLDFVIKEKDINVDDDSKNKEQSSNIYEVIEKEFGRTLSPIEYETIKHWLDSNIDEELIKEALKEAVLNGVNNLKYIDKILYEWNKKGYKKSKDIKRKQEDKKVELFEYDWLKENE